MFLKMELKPATFLHNRYKIIRLLGQGGMGAVYLAKDSALDHEVAVKVNQDPNPYAAGQFIAEARLLATLRHAHLPRVIDYFIEGASQFLVMDYIPGDDLKTLSEKMGAMPVEMVLKWVEQLGSALIYLHRQSPPIIHRDIKPANLKLTQDNEVVLVDFGIAKKSDPNQATATGATGYTPGYAPPEQYGSGRTGPHSDQYSLAATLYHLLTGQKPVDSIQRVLGQDILQPIAEIKPGIPQYIQSALERGLSLKPEDRFPTIETFLAALLPPTQSTPVRAPQPQSIQPASQVPAKPMTPIPPVAAIKWGRKLFWMGMLLLIGMIGLGGIGWLVAQYNQMPSAAIPAPTLTKAAPATAVPFPIATLPAPTLPPTATETPMPTPTQAPPTQTLTPNPTTTATLVPFAKGRGIAFSSDRADGKTLQIWLMDVNLNDQGQIKAGNFRQLTFDEGDKTQPAWSPDGNKLLYVAPGGKSANGIDWGLDIFLLDVTASIRQPVNLTHRPGDDTDPAWSPDGKWIALTNNGRSDKVKMIDLMAPDGSSIQRVSVDLQEFNPAWSPGMDLLYVTFARENNILYLRSAATVYTENGFFDNKGISTRTGQAADPAWSPDGSQVAYMRMEQVVGNVVYGNIHSALAASRGDQITKLTNLGWDRDPAWSPDSQWITFSSRRDLNLEIYLIRASGGQAINLTNRPGIDQQPAWRP